MDKKAIIQQIRAIDSQLYRVELTYKQLEYITDALINHDDIPEQDYLELRELLDGAKQIEGASA